MLNKIWFWLLVLGVTYGFGKAAFQAATGVPPQPPIRNAPADAPPAADAADAADAKPAVESVTAQHFQQMGRDLNRATIDAAELSVRICIDLIGFMALWLGLLRVAQDAGLVDALARGLRPAMRWLFPEVPDGHPAHGAMLMNMAANMLGLDNAATPLGLKAMQHLQTLNPQPDTATNAMATFLAINTSSITLIPFTIIAYRAAAGSDNPAGPLLAMILVTSISTIVAVTTVKWLARWPRFALPAEGPPDEPAPTAPTTPDAPRDHPAGTTRKDT